MTQLLNLEIYQFIFVFLRIGSAILLMPGFAVSYVTERQRLTIALAITVVLVPFLSVFLPPAPADFVRNYLRRVHGTVHAGALCRAQSRR